MNVKLHTKGIKGSAVVKPGEQPGVQYMLLVEIDGTLHPNVISARVLTDSQGMTQLVMRAMPSTIETINHDVDSWNELVSREEMKV